MNPVIVPYFLRKPPVPSLAYDQWRLVAGQATIVILISGVPACLLTYLASHPRLRQWLRRWGPYTPLALLLLPGVVAGFAAALAFSVAFDSAFHLPAPEIGSYLILCALWAALPQFIVAVSARWLPVWWSASAVAAKKRLPAAWAVMRQQATRFSPRRAPRPE